MIGTIKKITATTTAQDVNIDYQEFFIQNLSASQTVYFKEKDNDGVAVTADNGFALAPGATFEKCLQAKVLSIVASGSTDDGEADTADNGSADVRIMFVE